MVGPRLSDEGKLRELVTTLARARDEVALAAFSLEEPRGVYARMRVRDAAATEKALRGAVDLLRSEPFKGLLHVRDVTVSTDEHPTTTTAMIVREPIAQPHDAGAKKPSPLGIAWSVEAEKLSFAGGAEPLVTLRANAKERTLDRETLVTRFTIAIAKDASTLVVVQPLRLDPKRANLSTAPLGIAVGKIGAEGFVRIDLTLGLLREGVRWQMGF